MESEQPELPEMEELPEAPEPPMREETEEDLLAEDPEASVATPVNPAPRA
jgi:hypothetical protein